MVWEFYSGLKVLSLKDSSGVISSRAMAGNYLLMVITILEHLLMIKPMDMACLLT